MSRSASTVSRSGIGGTGRFLASPRAFMPEFFVFLSAIAAVFLGPSPMIVARVLFLDALGPRRKPINAVTSFFPAPLASGDRFWQFPGRVG